MLASGYPGACWRGAANPQRLERRRNGEPGGGGSPPSGLQVCCAIANRLAGPPPTVPVPWARPAQAATAQNTLEPLRAGGDKAKDEDMEEEREWADRGPINLQRV